jgi:hypothetical protein
MICWPMSMTSPSPLLTFLADRSSVMDLDAEGWSLLLAEARACGVMSRVASVLAADAANLAPQMPAQVMQHVVAATRQSDSLAHDVQRELTFLSAALAGVDTPKLLLKGAAYCAAGLPSAHGRIFSDIDLLVTRPFLPQAEAALMLGGWVVARQDAYDQRYYREWAHEIPPMTHVQRGTTIDLHHSLAMPTCRIPIDSDQMIAAAVPLPGRDHWFRLADEDMVLHAASHLLLNSEFDRGLRDLWDIDLLMRHFETTTPNFARRVLARAEMVGLGQIVRSAFALCHQFFRTPLPQEAMADGSLLLWLLARAATTRHPQTRPRIQGMADQLLFVREMALRLPSHLLLRHLWHKATVGFKRKENVPV